MDHAVVTRSTAVVIGRRVRTEAGFRLLSSTGQKLGVGTSTKCGEDDLQVGLHNGNPLALRCVFGTAVYPDLNTRESGRDPVEYQLFVRRPGLSLVDWDKRRLAAARLDDFHQP